MPDDVSVAYSGTADRLESAFNTMQTNLGIAAIVLLLILAAMFRSVWDAFLVMLSMPLAIAGGVIALRLLNLVTTQAMDLLTTIGFLILLGLVVNSAILLVMQTRVGQKKGLATVIIGGMFFSAVFTLILIPSILRFPLCVSYLLH